MGLTELPRLIRHSRGMRTAWALPFLLLASATPALAQHRGDLSRGWRTGPSPSRGSGARGPGSRGSGWNDSRHHRGGHVRGSARIFQGGAPSSRTRQRLTRTFLAPQRHSPGRSTWRRRSSVQLQVPGASVSIRGGNSPRVRVRTGVPGGTVTIRSGRGARANRRRAFQRVQESPSRRCVQVDPFQTRHSGLEYRGPGVRYTQRWNAPPAPSPYVERVVLISPVENASGAPAPLIVPARDPYRRPQHRRPQGVEVETIPFTSGRSRTRVETFVPRTTRPRSDSNSTRRLPRRALADQLMSTLEASDLAAACEVAAWAKDNPLREEILRTALFARFPSPTLLRDSLTRLRDDPASQDHPGRLTLARLLASKGAPR